MSFFRDDERVSVRWVPDPETRERRFIGEGVARLEPATVQRSFSELIDNVLERLRKHDDEEVAELRENWNAVLESEMNERPLCSALAALGVDPYDTEDIPESILDIAGKLDQLEAGLRSDLLNATTVRSVAADYAFVEQLSAELPVSYEHPQPGLIKLVRTDPSERPYRLGYLRARALRRDLEYPLKISTFPLQESIDRLFGRPHIENRVPVSQRSTRVENLLGFSQDCRPVLVGADKSRDTSRTFMTARALHHWLYCMRGTQRRLLTSGSSWEQRVSRAFAAELLAPAAAIQQHIDEEPGIEDETLAEQFGVSEWVIAHQVENHGLR